MDLRYLVLVLLNMAPLLRAREGFYHRDTRGVQYYGLEKLSTDIFEKIRRATGIPVKTNIFRSHPQSKDRGLMKHFLYNKAKSPSIAKKKGTKGFEFINLQEADSSRDGKKHFPGTGKAESLRKEKWGGTFEETSGSKDEFMNIAEFTDDHFHKEEEEKGEEFKGGRKRGRAFLSKGYEDVYRKDETKTLNSFWDNERLEGKWYKYGSRHWDQNKKVEKEEREKKIEEGKQGSNYMNEKKWQKEKDSKLKSKKEHYEGKEHTQEKFQFTD